MNENCRENFPNGSFNLLGFSNWGLSPLLVVFLLVLKIQAWGTYTRRRRFILRSDGPNCWNNGGVHMRGIAMDF